MSKESRGTVPEHARIIEPLVAMIAVPKPQRGFDTQQLDGGWDDEPLPNWVFAFEPHDPITQAFDEERQYMYESSQAPTRIESFDPCDANDVRRVLLHVRNMIRINLSLADLAKSLERSSDLAGTDQSEFHLELRTA